MTEDEMRRYADRQIDGLRKEFGNFVVRFEKHEALEEVRLQQEAKRQEDEDARFARIMEVQETILKGQAENTAAIAEVTKQVSAVVQDTADIVQLQRDLQGAGRLIGKLKTLAAAGGILGAIGTAGYWILTHFKH